MSYICPNTFRPCELTACVHGNLCNPNKFTTNNGIMQGWQCPRCLKIHSPFKMSCDCAIPVLSATTTNLPQQSQVTDLTPLNNPNTENK